jgi:hypothetical protein
MESLEEKIEKLYTRAQNITQKRVTRKPAPANFRPRIKTTTEQERSKQEK